MILVAALFLQAAVSTPTVEDIMTRVAENQNRAQDARKEWVYQQDILVRLHRPNGKLAREESRTYLVTPTPEGNEKKLQHFAGKYAKGSQFVDYDQQHYEYKSIDIDGDLADGLGDGFARDQKNKDGVDTDLFPLSAHEQPKYTYQLEGREDYRGISVYRVTFRPKKGADSDWKGEALIETTDFQPVVITTGLAWGVPGVVKVLLGTDVQHVGFKITYKKVADGLWFPETYGGEFNLKAVFLYKRTASIAVRNSEFRKTDVSTKIAYETPN